MADIFDEVDSGASRDIFDEVAPRSIFSRIGVGHGGTSNLDIIKSGLAGTARDVGQIPASFLNQLLLNLPRTAAKQYGIEYPEEKGVTSNWGRKAAYLSGIAGGVMNPLATTILKGGKLLPMMAKSAGLSMASSYKGENPEAMFKPETLAAKGTIGALIPPLAKGAEAAGRGLWNISKTGRDYIYNKIAEPVSLKISDFVKSRPELVQKALKLKNETVDVLRKYGYDRVSNPQAIEEEASAKFHEAMGNKSNVYGNKIDISNTLDKMRNYYNSIKKIEPRNPILKEIENLSRLRPAQKGFFQGMPGGLSEEAAVSKGQKLLTPTQQARIRAGESPDIIAKEVRLTREEFTHMRKRIMDLYKNTNFDPKILDIADALYDDAEHAGLTGIGDARKLWREFKETSKAKGDLSKLEKFTPEKIQGDIQSVVKDKKKYQIMIDRYTPYVGENEAKRMFDEALKIRSGETAKRVIKRVGVGLAVGGPASMGAYNLLRPRQSNSRGPY